jgi:phosphoglycolate phosphatase
MVHLLLFDVDGTLIQTGGAGIRAFRRTFQELFEIQVVTDRVRFHGRTDPEILEDLFAAELGRPPTTTEVRAICQRYLYYLDEEVPRSPGYRMMPGLPGLLELLVERTGVRIGLATGNLEEAARIKLHRADLNRFFSFGGFGSDAKDRTKLIRTAIERGQQHLRGPAPPIRVFVIGDTDLDITCGRAAGATTVAVATGGDTWETLRGASPDHLLQDLSRPEEFLAILDEDPSRSRQS